MIHGIFSQTLEIYVFVEKYSGVIWIPRAQFHHFGQLAALPTNNKFQINQIEKKSQ